MTNFASASDKTARSKSERSTDRLREEYLETLVSNPLLGTARGGGVSGFGFPSAEELLGQIVGLDANGETKKVAFERPVQQPDCAKLSAVAKQPSSLEAFAAMIELASKKTRPAERVVA